MENRKRAKEIVKNEGITINGRDVYFDVEKFEEQKEYPISEDELIPEWEQEKP